MLTTSRVAACALLAAALSGCALAGGDRLPTLAQLGLADRYALAPAQPPEAEGSPDRWWSLFGDPLLANLAERTQDAAARVDLGRAYVVLRLRQARIANVRAYLAAQSENRDVAHFRAEAKLVTERDVLQIEAESARAAADIPMLEAQGAADAARITALAGEAPGALREQLLAPVPIPAGPAAIDIGLPSTLLDRRPDLQAAALRLKAANILGRPSPASLATYRKAVLAAQDDVESALAAFDGAGAREHGLADALEKTEGVARLARQQYREGLADYDTLAGAEAALLAMRDALAGARAARARALIDLCIALGASEPPGKAAGALTVP